MPPLLGRSVASVAVRFRRVAADLRRRPADVLAVVLLVALPLVLLAANDSWIWDNPDFNDTSVYVGYFRRYLEFKAPYTESYKSSRLPWVLPGVLLYRWLPAAAAHHVLYLTFLIGEGLLLLAFARRRFGLLVGFVVAAAAVTSTFTHMRTSYHDQPAATYFLAALVLLERPARWPWLLRMVLAGGAFALDLTTDTATVMFGPMFALFVAAAVPRRSGLQGWLSAAGALLVGAVGALGLVGLLNVALGGQLFFFVQQIDYSRAMARSKTLSYSTLDQILGALPLYPILIMPALSVVAGGAWLVVRAARRRPLDAGVLPVVGLLLTMGAGVVMQVGGLGALEHEVLFQPFHVVVYLALGAMMGGLHRVAPVRSWWLVVVAALFVVPLAVFGQRISMILATSPPMSEGPGMAFKVTVLGSAFVAAVVVAYARRARERAVLSAAALAVVNAFCTSGSQPAYMYQAGASCPFRGETFQALLEADDALEPWDPDHVAHFASEEAPLLAPVSNGRDWCTMLPLGLTSNAVLLPRYFYSSTELARGWPEPRAMSKLAVAGTSPTRLYRVVDQLASTLRPDQRFVARVNKVFFHKTFELYLLGLDVVPFP